jgi:hypothetical protein
MAKKSLCFKKGFLFQTKEKSFQVRIKINTTLKKRKAINSNNNNNIFVSHKLMIREFKGFFRLFDDNCLTISG